MYEYILYFIVTFITTSIFSMGGIGGGIILISIFPMLGLNFTMSKVLALFITTATMTSTSVMNIYRKVVNFKIAIPIALLMLVFTPLGALLSQYVDQVYSKIILMFFSIIGATLLLLDIKKSKTKHLTSFVLYPLIIVISIFSGMVGIGGGLLILPMLVLLGLDIKKSAYIVSFIIPFSTIGAFFTYLQFVQLDFMLLGVTTVGALLGGYTGGAIMHYSLSQNQIKKILSVILYFAGIKIFIELL